MDSDPPRSGLAGRPAGDRAPDRTQGVGGVGERRLGFPTIHIGGLTPVTDDHEALAEIAGSGQNPFHGAYVPLVIHDPRLAERSYDAGEWAAELISVAGGSLLVIAPYAEAGSVIDGPRLTARQWNHAAAMVERIDSVCRRFSLTPVVRDTVSGVEVGSDGERLADRPVVHLIDTGQYKVDGYQPTVLVCPEAIQEDMWTSR